MILIIEKERVKVLNEGRKKGDYVLYWMQASQRESFNPALEYSIKSANDMDIPLLVYFGVTENFQDGNKRHYKFMLEGLEEVKSKLIDRGIQIVIRNEHPKEGVIGLAEDAALLVTDRAYLRFLREWREYVSERVDCRFIQVEGDVVVPVETASQKEEYGAYTIRPKINGKRERFLKNIEKRDLNKSSLDYDFDSYSVDDIDESLKRLFLPEVDTVNTFIGGTSNAERRLNEFVADKLDRFSDLRNDPSENYLSNLSPYVHFGQISPVKIALKVKESGTPSVENFLEELIVRRELSMNFVYYNEEYDSLKCLPDWAYKTLESHENDEREYIYSHEEFEQAKTHDPYWNAAQKEMVLTGKMHGYMRMYWGKKIIEWSETPEQAYDIMVTLNNKYELDGRDPNGYAGIAWCFGKHDRAWKEREIFGKVRYMNANGLKRKFDIEKYVEKVEDIDKK